MKANEYFLKMINTPHSCKLKWYYSVFTLPINNTHKNDYYRITNDTYQVNINGEWFDITDKNPSTEPVLHVNDIITIPVGTFINIRNDVETTIGLVIINYLFLIRIYGNIFEYQNKKVDGSYLEHMVVKALKEDKVTVEQHLKFMMTATFFETLSRIITVSSTPKTIVPPPGIKEFKTKTRQVMTDKYGPNWVKDKSRIVEYENILKKYAADYLEDDPSDGKVMSGKIKNDAYVKMYLCFGAEAAFDETGTDVNLIDNSLLEGYQKNAKDLSVVYNTSRAGSYYRGKETQNGGATAKDMLRAAGNIVITPGDCGSILGHTITVKPFMAENLIGRYIIDNNNNIIRIESTENLIGKTITIRSPKYCKSENGPCSICVGDHQAKYPDGVPIILTDISGNLLNASLKRMHASKSSTMNFNIFDSLR